MVLEDWLKAFLPLSMSGDVEERRNCCFQLSASVLRAALIYQGTWITSPVVAEEDIPSLRAFSRWMSIVSPRYHTAHSRPHFTPC